jgi:hypothetical protein
MPTVLRSGAYRLFFFSGDGTEQAHIHVERDDSVAKYWLAPVRIENSGGFGKSELRRIQRLFEEHEERLLKAWHDYFKG